MSGGDRGYDPLYDPLPDEFYARGRREADRQDPYGEQGRPWQQEATGGPERYDAPAGGRPAAQDGYRAAVEAMNDPLTDPLPDAAGGGARGNAEAGSPWFSAGRPPGAGPAEQAGNQRFEGPNPGSSSPGPGPQAYARSAGPPAPGPSAGGYGPGGRPPGAPGGTPAHATGTPYGERAADGRRPGGPPHRPEAAGPGARGIPGARPPAADAGQTAAMPAVDDASAGPSRTLSVAAEEDDRTMALRTDDDPVLAGGGRAARRKAARGRGDGAGSDEAAAAPASRLAARRAARAAKDGPVVLLSRFIGEMFITCGVLMLLFVTYQLWWTNVQAHERADSAANNLVQKWKDHPARKAGAFDPGQGFAIMYIPKLDVRAPISQGVNKEKILDKGMVGHYDESSGVPTAMPWDKTGNFAVAAHRNTHGEPFRYINRLVAGDKIVVETADTYYTYEMYSRLPSTPPSNTGVIDPVPQESGFKKPGRYITLTTCTPEFTSRYRLIVWGKMVDERPRSEGKPDALIR